MSNFLTRRLINRGLIGQYRGMALSSIKADAPKNTAAAQPNKKTALYDFHVKNVGRM